MLMKRLFDVVVSFIGLLLLTPLLVLIAFLIKLTSPGPVFFKQPRVGRFGSIFLIHKFRTMVVNAEQLGLKITVGRDPRITKIGHFLRRSKLDELPQLIDVFLGRMSMVGPRPEVPEYVACYPEALRSVVLSVRPGITDLASIEFRDESAILGEASDPRKAYIERILPIKLKYYVEYVENQSFLRDFYIILKTILAIFFRNSSAH